MKRQRFGFSGRGVGRSGWGARFVMWWMRKFVRVGAFRSIEDKRLLRHLCAVGMVLAMAGSPLRARAAHSIFGATPMPDWARTAARQTLPSFPGAPKAVVLLEEQTYTVAADGVAVEHVRRVVKILRPQGRDYGYQAVWYDKDSKILSMHVWSIDAAGHEYTANDNDFLEVSPPGEGGELAAPAGHAGLRAAFDGLGLEGADKAAARAAFEAARRFAPWG